MLDVEKPDITNFNFSLPKLIADEFRNIGDVHGERNKLRWAVAAAAVLRLLEMPDEEMRALIERVAGARHFPSSLRRMVEEAKAKAIDSDPTVESIPDNSGDAHGGHDPEGPAPDERTRRKKSAAQTK
jgi:hypothetical protein